MAKPKFKKHEVVSPIKEALAKAKERSAATLANDDSMLISLKHLDTTQGDTLEKWDSSDTLSPAVKTLHGYSSKPILAQVDGKKFTIYGDFPPDGKTEFYHPKHIPEDAEWARIHVNGKQCIIGHIVQNTFYLVFLDGEHRFWTSSLKHT